MRNGTSRFVRLLEYSRRNFWWVLLIALGIVLMNELFLESRRDITIGVFLFSSFLTFIVAIAMIRRAWLLLHENPDLKIGSLIVADILGAIGIILLFAMFYVLVDMTGAGALSYAHCGQSLAETLKYPVVRNPLDTIYFAAITFFTVGYGDICPMGTAKAVAVFNALGGQLFTSIVVGTGVAFFMESSAERRKK